MNSRAKWAAVFYWIGVAMTVTCVGLVLAGNTKWGYRLEHAPFPISWLMAGIGVIAFLAGEVCRPSGHHGKTSHDRNSHVSPKYNGAFEI